MNPYLFVRDSIFPTLPTGIENDALYCLLSLASDGYSSGFTRGPANNEFDYVVRTLTVRFNATPASTPTPSPAILKLKNIVGGRLG